MGVVGGGSRCTRIRTRGFTTDGVREAWSSRFGAIGPAVFCRGIERDNIYVHRHEVTGGRQRVVRTLGEARRASEASLSGRWTWCTDLHSSIGGRVRGAARRTGTIGQWGITRSWRCTSGGASGLPGYFQFPIHSALRRAGPLRARPRCGVGASATTAGSAPCGCRTRRSSRDRRGRHDALRGDRLPADLGDYI